MDDARVIVVPEANDNFGWLDGESAVVFCFGACWNPRDVGVWMHEQLLKLSKARVVD